jgi:hypothetical protein
MFVVGLLVFLGSGRHLLDSVTQRELSTAAWRESKFIFFNDDRLFSKNRLPSDIDSSWRYVFPGDEIRYVISDDEALPFSVDLLSAVRDDGTALRWHEAIVKNVDGGGPSSFECDIYRITPLGKSKIGRGECPDREPGASVTIKLSNDLSLIGTKAAFRIDADNRAAEVVEFKISDPLNAAENIRTLAELRESSVPLSSLVGLLAGMMIGVYAFADLLY